jgi:hypothetical protein
VKNVTELKLAPGEVVFLDRIEDADDSLPCVATLLLGEGGSREENVPRDQLPPEAREGDRLRMTEDGRLHVDREATDAGRAAVADLMAELLGEPVPGPEPPPAGEGKGGNP